MKRNEKLNKIITDSRFFRYEIASAIGIREEIFSKWFRKELTIEQEEMILIAIEKLKGGGHNASV